MKLEVTQALAHPGQEYRFSGTQAIADQEIGGDLVRLDECIVEGRFMADEEGNVSLKGQLRTIAHARCAKCLGEAQAPVENAFDETFLRGGDPEDDESFAYTSSVVRFEKLAMSYAVLALPMRILCREDCDGRPDGSLAARADNGAQEAEGFLADIAGSEHRNPGSEDASHGKIADPFAPGNDFPVLVIKNGDADLSDVVEVLQQGFQLFKVKC